MIELRRFWTIQPSLIPFSLKRLNHAPRTNLTQTIASGLRRTWTRRWSGSTLRFPRVGPHAAAQRKTLQWCAQICRAIKMALCGHPEDIFRDMRVGCVVAARGPGRLLVTLVATPSALKRPLEEWIEAVARLAPQLRLVTAQTIHRRKVPELVLQWGQAN